MHCLVQGAAVGGEPLREDIDGYAVDEEGDGDAALMGGEHCAHGDGDGAGDIGSLDMMLGVEVLGGGQVREVEVAKLDVTVLPLQPDGRHWRPGGWRT